MTRRKFGVEFKIEAVKLVIEQGGSVAQAAYDLDLVESVLRCWMRELPQPTSPAMASSSRAWLILRRSRRSVAKLKAERGILKKATAYFAKDST